MVEFSPRGHARRRQTDHVVTAPPSLTEQTTSRRSKPEGDARLPSVEGVTTLEPLNVATPFAALTLRSLLNERHDFLMTTFPIADANQAIPSPVVFPQIADGGGFITQVILVSSGSGSKTTLGFFDDDGNPLPAGK
jgi:hypothetical protein